MVLICKKPNQKRPTSSIERETSDPRPPVPLPLVPTAQTSIYAANVVRHVQLDQRVELSKIYKKGENQKFTQRISNASKNFGLLVPESVQRRSRWVPLGSDPHGDHTTGVGVECLQTSSLLRNKA